MRNETVLEQYELINVDVASSPKLLGDMVNFMQFRCHCKTFEHPCECFLVTNLWLPSYILLTYVTDGNTWIDIKWITLVQSSNILAPHLSKWTSLGREEIFTVHADKNFLSWFTFTVSTIIARSLNNFLTNEVFLTIGKISTDSIKSFSKFQFIDVIIEFEKSHYTTSMYAVFSNSNQP